MSSSPTISTTGKKTLCVSNTSISTYVSPHNIRPYPKAGPRKNIEKGRKKGATKILTDTPEKEAIERYYRDREEKKKRKNAAAAKRNLSKEKPKSQSKVKIQRRNLEETSSDEENIPLLPSPDSDAYAIEDEIDEKSESEENDDGDDENVHEGDWVIVNMVSEKNLVHPYVGQILKEHLASYDIKFAKKIKDNKFKWPEKIDISLIGKYQVAKRLV